MRPNLMLNSLRNLVQEVNSARDLQSALDIIVDRVKQIMQTEVCSIYLRDTDSRYRLMATEGLKKEAVGKVSLDADSGLVGWVVARAEPLNLDAASQHPRYQYFPETGEERYQAFLGAPIIHHRQVVNLALGHEHQSFHSKCL